MFFIEIFFPAAYQLCTPGNSSLSLQHLWIEWCKLYRYNSVHIWLFIFLQNFNIQNLAWYEKYQLLIDQLQSINIQVKNVNIENNIDNIEHNFVNKRPGSDSGSREPTVCPPASPLTADQCRGQFSTCWSVGVPDLDCPNWGLCCFDGCANTCLAEARDPPQPTYQPAPRNPCEPNPCGPGSMCIPQEGGPTCKCPEGLVPDPTPQQGCVVPNPCDPNPCGEDAMCIPQEGRPFCKCPEGLEPDPSPEIRCSVRNPCHPSPCGPGTSCTPNPQGNPICRCLPGLVPKPDTITGCGPECQVDPDVRQNIFFRPLSQEHISLQCQYGYVCRNQRCVEKPDPCNPSPCGPGTTCTPSHQGNPICRCLPGLIPKPDTITGQTTDLMAASQQDSALLSSHSRSPRGRESLFSMKIVRESHYEHYCYT